MYSDIHAITTAGALKGSESGGLDSVQPNTNERKQGLAFLTKNLIHQLDFSRRFSRGSQFHPSAKKQSYFNSITF